MTMCWEKADAAEPGRCSRCGSVMTWPVVCDRCGALFVPDEQDVDYFRLLGIARRYCIGLERLRHNFLELSRRVHPDFFSAQDDATRSASVRITAAINMAYQVLSDPVRRAEYILRLCGGQSEVQDRSVPAELLSQVMLLREEVEEARAAGDAQRLAELADQVEAERTRCLRRIADLAERLCTEPDGQTCRELRQELNAYGYWDNLARLLERHD